MAHNLNPKSKIIRRTDMQINHEAEAVVLGSLLKDPKRLGEVLEVLPDPTMFADLRYRRIYSAMIAAAQKGDWDERGVVVELSAVGELESAGGRVMLVELMEGVAVTERAAQHAEKVRDSYRRRKLVSLLHESVGRAAIDDPAEFGAHIADSLGDILAVGQRYEVMSVADAVPDVVEGINRRVSGDDHDSRFKTGFPDLDRLLGGLVRTRLYTIAGKTGHGKTQLALQIAVNIAAAGVPVLVFSLEMSTHDLVERLVLNRARVSSSRVIAGVLSADDWDRIARAQNAIASLPLYIDDGTDLTPDTLRTRTKMAVMRWGIGAVVVDYFQLMSAPEANDHVVGLEKMSRATKLLAKEANVPVLQVSQLRKMDQAHAGAARKPGLDDIHGSSAVVKDSNVVMFVWQHPPMEIGTTECRARVFVEKNREGTRGDIPMAFVDGRWESITRSER